MTIASLPDWRDPAAYASLAALDRRGFAWEYLRRNPRYRADAATMPEAVFSMRGDVPVISSPPSAVRPWGLDFADPPDTPAPQATLFWHEALDDAVLPAVRRAPSSCAPFDLARLARYATILDDGSVEHLCLSDGLRRLCIDLAGEWLGSAELALRFLIDDDAAMPVRLRELTRFRALCRRGTFAAWLEEPAPQRTRWILQLRTLDALAEGATQREIAAALFPARAADGGWRESGESLRSVVRRLTRAARQMCDAGYRSLLHHG